MKSRIPARDKILPHNPDYFLLTACFLVGFGLVPRNCVEFKMSKRLEVALNQLSHSALYTEGIAESTQFYNKLKSLKGTPYEVKGDDNEYRAITVTLLVMSLITLGFGSCDKDMYPIFMRMLDSMVSGVPSDLLVNTLSCPFFTSGWVTSYMYALWLTVRPHVLNISSKCSGKYSLPQQQPIIWIKTTASLYFLCLNDADLARRMFGAALGYLLTGSLHNAIVSKALLNVIHGIFPLSDKANISYREAVCGNIADLNMRGIKLPTHKSLDHFEDWSSRDKYEYTGDIMACFNIRKLPTFEEAANSTLYDILDKPDLREFYKASEDCYLHMFSFVLGDCSTNNGVYDKTTPYITKLKTTISDLESKNKSLNELNNRIKTQLSDIKQENSSLKKQNAALSADITKLRQQLEQANSDARPEIEGMRCRIKNLTDLRDKQAERIRTLEFERDSSRDARETLNKLESENEYLKAIIASYQEEVVDESFVINDEVKAKLAKMRAHLVLPDLNTLKGKLEPLIPNCRISYVGAGVHYALEMPKNMELYFFCTKMSMHSSWHYWKKQTKNYPERRVYLPQTGITSICKLLIDSYDKIVVNTPVTV